MPGGRHIYRSTLHRCLVNVSTSMQKVLTMYRPYSPAALKGVLKRIAAFNAPDQHRDLLARLITSLCLPPNLAESFFTEFFPRSIETADGVVAWSAVVAPVRDVQPPTFKFRIQSGATAPAIRFVVFTPKSLSCDCQIFWEGFICRDCFAVARFLLTTPAYREASGLTALVKVLVTRITGANWFLNRGQSQPLLAVV